MIQTLSLVLVIAILGGGFIGSYSMNRHLVERARQWEHDKQNFNIVIRDADESICIAYREWRQTTGEQVAGMDSYCKRNERKTP